MLVHHTALRVLTIIFLLEACVSASHGRNINAPTSDGIGMGTTLVAVRHATGVVVAADARTSASGYVSHRFAHKISPITDSIVMLRSGSAADTQHLAQDVATTMADRSYRYRISPSVQQVANYVRWKVYRSNNLSVSLLLAGYDENNQSARIFSVAPSGALLEEGRFAVSGSGSSYILGFLDENVSDDMSEEECIDLCRKAIELAVQRDGSSGGTATIVSIGPEGRRRVLEEELSESSSEDVEPVRLSGFASAVANHLSTTK